MTELTVTLKKKPDLRAQARETTEEDIQLELNLYPVKEGEVFKYSIDSSIRIAGPQ